MSAAGKLMNEHSRQYPLVCSRCLPNVRRRAPDRPAQLFLELTENIFLIDRYMYRNVVTVVLDKVPELYYTYSYNINTNNCFFL